MTKWLTRSDSEKPQGLLRKNCEDFVVEEIPAYLPCGKGGHLYVTLRKRDLTTEEALRRLCREFGTERRSASMAGLKDRRAITTQTVSLEVPRGVSGDELRERVLSASLEGIEILSASLHGNKLRPGHLRGNRFQIVVREVSREAFPEVLDVLRSAAASGIPNRFGDQRFGREGGNVERALRWLRDGGPAPRDPRLRRLLWSSVQSEIFNRVLSARIADGSWIVPEVGDLLKLEEGGMFLCEDALEALPRAESGELCPTGPMVGAQMRSPGGRVLSLENSLAAEVLGADFDLSKTRALGEGTRRPLRVPLAELVVEEVSPDDPGVDTNCGKSQASFRVSFVLPKGAYATTVLSCALVCTEPGKPVGSRESSDDSGGQQGDASFNE